MELYKKHEVKKDTTVKKISMVAEAEKFLNDIGFKYFRVIQHGEIARIEVDEFERVCFFDLGIMDKIEKRLKKIGFKFVTLDLKGYSTNDPYKSMSKKEI
jgi:pyridinium-3,5-biscarboxylic acid mononucleotide sulfurtransferase